MPNKFSQIAELVKGIDPRTKMPRGFDLWSVAMQIGWLRQHQKNTANRRARVRIIWQKRNEITRSVVVQDSIHVANLVETLAKAPKVIRVEHYLMEKGERAK